MAATAVLFGATWGNPADGVTVLIVMPIMTATGLMALTATLARNAGQAANWVLCWACGLGVSGAAASRG